MANGGQRYYCFPSLAPATNLQPGHCLLSMVATVSYLISYIYNPKMAHFMEIISWLLTLTSKYMSSKIFLFRSCLWLLHLPCFGSLFVSDTLKPTKLPSLRKWVGLDVEAITWLLLLLQNRFAMLIAHWPPLNAITIGIALYINIL